MIPIKITRGDDFNRKTFVRVGKATARKMFNYDRDEFDEEDHGAPFIYLRASHCLHRDNEYKGIGWMIYKNNKPNFEDFTFDDFVDFWTRRTPPYYPMFMVEQTEAKEWKTREKTRIQA